MFSAPNILWNCSIFKRLIRRNRNDLTAVCGVILFCGLWFALLGLSVSTPVLAQGGNGVTARITGPNLVDAEPRRVIVASFLVENQLNRPVTLLEVLDLPDEWQPLMLTAPFTLAAGASEVRLVSFRVPISALAQRYSVTYGVNDIDDSSIRGQDTLQIAVMPTMKLELSVDETPHSVIAGQSYRIKFTAANFSNVPMRIVVERDSRGGAALPSPAEFNARPGAKTQITVEVDTDADLRRQLDEILTVTITGTPLTDDEGAVDDISASASARVRIFPRISGTEDYYHRLPVALNVISSSTRASEADNQVELSGGGFLGQAGGGTYVDFLLRSPGAEAAKLFGLREEYRMLVQNNYGRWRVGDFAYRLTPLTEAGRYGRGFSAAGTLNKLSVGAYYVRDIELDSRNESAASVGYNLTDDMMASINYLQKSNLDRGGDPLEEDKIGSIEIRANPMPPLNLELEYSAGLSDTDSADQAEQPVDNDAHRVELYGDIGSDRVNYRLQHLYAGPGYRGYYQDQEFTRAALSLRLFGSLRLEYFYNGFENNLLLDANKNSAINERRESVGFQYNLPLSTQLSVNYEQAAVEDRLSLTERQDESYRLGFSGNWNQFSIVAAITQGSSHDSSADGSTDIHRNLLSALFTPTSNQRYGIYYEDSNIDFTSNTQPNNTQVNQNAKGINGAYQWRDRLRVIMDYRDNSISRDQFTAHIEYYRRNNHRLLIRARHLFGDNALLEDGPRRADDSILSVSYSVPINVPIRRRTEIGALEGRVFDVDDPKQKGIADVIVRVNGAVAVTDEDGYFLFPSLTPASYQLVVEDDGGNREHITALPTPIPITVTGGETGQFDIAMTRAASFSGSVRVYQPANSRAVFSNDEVIPDEELRDAHGLANATAQLIKGEERINTFTDADGRFRFSDLRPGRWTLRLLQADLPRFTRVEGATVNPPYINIPIEVRAGDKLEQTIKVLPVTRSIEIIDDGVVLR